jgi:hypothetical protein
MSMMEQRATNGTGPNENEGRILVGVQPLGCAGMLKRGLQHFADQHAADTKWGNQYVFE